METTSNPIPNRASPRATITDVARLAGVSIKTVSRVTNAEPNVRESTRSRVQAAIDALGYRPNPYARYLGSMRAGIQTQPIETARTSGD